MFGGCCSIQSRAMAAPSGSVVGSRSSASSDSSCGLPVTATRAVAGVGQRREHQQRGERSGHEPADRPRVVLPVAEPVQEEREDQRGFDHRDQPIHDQRPIHLLDESKRDGRRHRDDGHEQQRSDRPAVERRRQYGQRGVGRAIAPALPDSPSRPHQRHHDAERDGPDRGVNVPEGERRQDKTPNELGDGDRDRAPRRRRIPTRRPAAVWPRSTPPG